jgi:hypothetical protein
MSDNKRGSATFWPDKKDWPLYKDFGFGCTSEEDAEAIHTYLTCINADEGGFFFSRPYLRRGNPWLKKGKQLLKTMEYQRRMELADQYRRQ